LPGWNVPRRRVAELMERFERIAHESGLDKESQTWELLAHFDGLEIRTPTVSFPRSLTMWLSKSMILIR